jgi:hypothetical protein
MNILLSDLGGLTLLQIGTALWRGFKDPVLSVYHLIVNRTDASILHFVYLVGILLFFFALRRALRFLFKARSARRFAVRRT